MSLYCFILCSVYFLTGVLKEENGTGMIELNTEHDGSNPIPDVAEVLVSVLERENTFRKVIKMRSGNTPISSALANI